MTLPLTRSTQLASAAALLESHGIPTARREAEWILMHVLQCGRVDLISRPDDVVEPEDAQRFQNLVDRRARREPLQYVLGETEFLGLRLEVTSDVLIPRPETEDLVSEVLRVSSGSYAFRVLDVGVGSGCIALALKHRRPGWTVVGCDVSAAALGIARSNADRLGLVVDLLQADVFDAGFPSRTGAPFDIVVSNPPYVAFEEEFGLQPEVVDHEPRLALFAGNDPLRFYRRFSDLVTRLVVPGGLLALECHSDHAGSVAGLLRTSASGAVEVLPDLAGLPRVVTLRR